MEIYQNLPQYINPIAFEVGFFAIHWYALMYLVGFAVFYFLIAWRIKKREQNLHPGINKNILLDFVLYAMIGLLIGARVGYIFFYNFQYFWQNPAQIIWPFDVLGNFVGLSGMSYHGGLAGVILATVIFCRIKKINFWAWGDFVLPAIPAGFFFGRMGNFLNGELYGRITTWSGGMYFLKASDNFLHFPSQLLEALLEGVILFLIFWTLRNRKMFPGWILAGYIFSYGIMRFVAEFFRQPDSQIGFFWNFLTLGQIFSLIMMFLGALLWFLRKNQKSCIMAILKSKNKLMDKDNKRFFALSFLAVLIVGGLMYWGFQNVGLQENEKNVLGEAKASSNIILFYGKGCPHCKDVEKFLEENKIAEKVRFDNLEVWFNKENSKLLGLKADECGMDKEKLGVPFLYADGKCLVGAPDIENFFKQKAGIQ